MFFILLSAKKQIRSTKWQASPINLPPPIRGSASQCSAGSLPALQVYINDFGVFIYGHTGSGNATVRNNAVFNATTGINVSVHTEGVNVTDRNLPPYYALCYIMKT